MLDFQFLHQETYITTIISNYTIIQLNFAYIFMCIM